MWGLELPSIRPAVHVVNMKNNKKSEVLGFSFYVGLYLGITDIGESVRNVPIKNWVFKS